MRQTAYSVIGAILLSGIVFTLIYFLAQRDTAIAEFIEAKSQLEAARRRTPPAVENPRIGLFTRKCSWNTKGWMFMNPGSLSIVHGHYAFFDGKEWWCEGKRP